MLLNIFVVNTEIIQGQELEDIINLAKNEFGLPKIPSKNHLLLCTFKDEEEEDFLAEIEALNISNPAYEVVRKEINNQAELENISLLIDLEER